MVTRRPCKPENVVRSHAEALRPSRLLEGHQAFTLDNVGSSHIWVAILKLVDTVLRHTVSWVLDGVSGTTTGASSTQVAGGA